MLFDREQWRRLVPTSPLVLLQAWNTWVHYATFHLPAEPNEFYGYNALQQIAYFTVVFGPLAILMNPTIKELTAAVEQEAKKWPEVLRLMTHPGVGPLTALAFVLIIGTPERFRCGKQIGSYIGLIPSEDSSAGQQRLGHISKQGNALLRYLLVEAAQAATRSNPDWRRRYVHLAMRRQKNIAKVAMGRRLAVRLYWMWRNGWEYSQSAEFGSYAGQLVTGHGVN